MAQRDARRDGRGAEGRGVGVGVCMCASPTWSVDHRPGGEGEGVPARPNSEAAQRHATARQKGGGAGLSENSCRSEQQSHGVRDPNPFGLPHAATERSGVPSCRCHPVPSPILGHLAGSNGSITCATWALSTKNHTLEKRCRCPEAGGTTLPPRSLRRQLRRQRNDRHVQATSNPTTQTQQ
jgi:hypothetical protein